MVAMTLVAWQGILLSIPHHHADSTVPQEEIGCSVSRPLSHENHLHGAGAELTPHPCVACLFGNTEAVETSVVSGSPGSLSIARKSAIGVDCRWQSHSRLPLLRGPPSLV